MKFNQMSDQVGHLSGYGGSKRNSRTFLKQALLLTTAIFLMSAPAPDSHDITEITASFIVTMHPSDSPSYKTGE